MAQRITYRSFPVCEPGHDQRLRPRSRHRRDRPLESKQEKAASQTIGRELRQRMHGCLTFGTGPQFIGPCREAAEDVINPSARLLQAAADMYFHEAVRLVSQRALCTAQHLDLESLDIDE